jgi:hypothetical protein
MMVAWHEMPGGRAGKIRPVEYGMIRVSPGTAIRVCLDYRSSNSIAAPSHRTLRDVWMRSPFQALRARLPSFCPSRTGRVRFFKRLARPELGSLPARSDLPASWSSD